MQSVSNTIKHPNGAHTDEIINDEKTFAAKKTVLRNFRSNTILESIGTVAALISGPLIGWGLVNAVGLATGAAAATVSIAAVATTLAVGAAIAAIAVGANYFAKRKAQSAIFDSQEAISQSNARNLVHELETHNLCLTGKDNTACEPPQRRDGKTWVDATRPQATQQEAAR